MIKLLTSEKFYLPIIYISIGIVTFQIISYMLHKVLKNKYTPKKGLDKRKMTIFSLIRNIIKYTIAMIVIAGILGTLGIDTTSLIASLGVVGIIIGLACEDIAKDFLAGIFIIFDNEYAVGDYVSINGFMGEVISLGLRSTKIKAYRGEIKILSNSSFNEVINYNLSNYKQVLKIPLSYKTSITAFEKILTNLKKEILNIENVQSYTLLGINDFNSSSIEYAIELECKPMCQYSIKRKVLRLIKDAMDQNGMEIPYNKLDVKIEK